MSPIKAASTAHDDLSELQGLGPIDMSKTPSQSTPDEYVQPS